MESKDMVLTETWFSYLPEMNYTNGNYHQVLLIAVQ